MAIKALTNFCHSQVAQRWNQNISLGAAVVVVLALGVFIARRCGLGSVVRGLFGRATVTLPPKPEGPKAVGLFDFLNRVSTYVSYTSTLGGGRTKFGGLVEIVGNDQSLNRLNSSRRADMEAEILKNVQMQQPDKKAKLRYLGTEGGQGLLQDYINIGKLIQAGYKNIEVVLYNEYDVHNSAKQTMDFLTEVAEERNIQLTITYMKAFSEIKDQFHIIQIRDHWTFEKVFPFFWLHGRLASQGTLYLMCDDWNFGINSKKCTHQFFGQKTAYPIEELGASLQEAAEKIASEELKVAFLNDNFYLQQWVQLLPKMCKREELKRVHLTLLPPQNSRDVVGDIYERKSLNPAFQSTSSVGKLLSLLCGKEVVVTYIDSPSRAEGIHDRFFSPKFFDAEYDIIALLFYDDAEEYLKLRIEELQSKPEKPILFFDLTAKDPIREENDWIDETADADEDLTDLEIPALPIPGSREEHPHAVWQGTWKWEQDLGVTFIGDRANAEDRKNIKTLSN